MSRKYHGVHPLPFLNYQVQYHQKSFHPLRPSSEYPNDYYTDYTKSYVALYCCSYPSLVNQNPSTKSLASVRNYYWSSFMGLVVAFSKMISVIPCHQLLELQSFYWDYWESHFHSSVVDEQYLKFYYCFALAVLACLSSSYSFHSVLVTSICSIKQASLSRLPF